MIKVVLPYHLRNLARVKGGEVEIEIAGTATIAAALEGIEQKYPMLRGTIRDHASGKRRDFLRYFACGQDLSHEHVKTLLPEKVMSGEEPFIVLGAIAGG
ncbi:MAG: hypothetical protein ABI210_14395 [Abditibacteriaceae bacterium]